MDAMETLVIILSVFLAIFLLLGIILAVLLVRVTQQIKRVTGTAERTATSIEKAVSGFAKVSSPLVIAKIIKQEFDKRRK